MELLKFNEGQVPSRQEIEDAAIALHERYANGGLDVNALRDYVWLKALEQFIKIAIPVVQPWATADATKYEEKERKNLYGTQISIRAGETVYEYPDDDVAINASRERVEILTDELKAAKKDLKDAQERCIQEQRAKFVSKGVETLTVKIL